MTIKTDSQGQITHSAPGITTTDIPTTKKFLQEFDTVFGKRCVKHRQEEMPCVVCEEDERNGFIRHRK